MNSFRRFFQAERVKWRRDWTLLVALLMPFTQVGTLLLIMWMSGDKASWLGTGFIAWYKINYIAWNLVLMPIAVALVSALSWDLEEKSRGWNHLLVMPAARAMHLLVKMASHLSLALISQVILALLLICGGLILRTYLPSLPMGTVAPSLLFHFMVYSAAASIPIISLHAWFPSRFPSLGSSLGLALTGSWFAFHYSGMKSFICLVPWGLASQVTEISLRAKLPSEWMYASSVFSAVLIFIFALWDFNRRAGTLNR